MGVPILGWVVLGSLRKESEQAMGSKPVGSGTAPWPLLWFLPWLLLVLNGYLEIEDKISRILFEFLLVMVIYHNRKLTKALYESAGERNTRDCSPYNTLVSL